MRGLRRKGERMAQAKMKTPAQLRRIYGLARERGLDDEMLHAYVCQLTGRESLKDLTMKEAARVIDALGPSGGFTAGGITPRQWKYMLGLAKELGWTDREGNADTKKLDEFALRNYKKYAVRWLTVREAGKMIEGLKAIMEKDTHAGKKARQA